MEEKNLSGILLTPDKGFLGPITGILGKIMEAIFYVIDMIGLPYIALAIILFTIIMNLLMLPLTIRQQKFSKLSAKMNPELMAIREKYKNKKDNDSMMAMNQETQAVYEKYGVSPSGSCLQLLIQMPILFALYRVIYSVPAYVGQVKDVFMPVVDKIINNANALEFVKNFKNSGMYLKNFTEGNETNAIIDCLNRASSADWQSLKENFVNMAPDIDNALNSLNQFNKFFGLNIADSPSFIIGNANGNMLLIIGAIAIPFLAAFTQWFNTKLMPQANANNDGTDTMAQSMKTMNVIMPLMSAFFCYSLPVGLGIYWIAGAVIRSIIQVAINKHIDKIDFDEEIKKNLEKKKKKLEKMGVSGAALNNYASMNTKSVTSSSNANSNRMSQEERDAAVKKATEYYSKNAKPGSIAAKANMVKEYNERNNK